MARGPAAKLARHREPGADPLSGETKPSHEGAMDFVDNRLDVAIGSCAAARSCPTPICRSCRASSPVIRVIGSAPYETLLLPDTAITNDQSRKVVFVVGKDDVVEMRPVTLGPA